MTRGVEPCPRPAERRATCARCDEDYTPDRAPRGCPRCFVRDMAGRVLDERRDEPERPTCPRPSKPVANEAFEAEAVDFLPPNAPQFQQWEGDDEIPF